MTTPSSQAVDLAAYLHTPFARRWEAKLKRAMDEGGWWCLCGGSQHGKTTSNVRFVALHCAVKRDGMVSVPVALTCASRTEGVLLASLAESLGGARLMRMPNRTIRIAQAIRRAGTRLIVVQNAHYMSPRQWEQMYTLEEECKKLHVDPAVVFSSLHPHIGVVAAKSEEGATEQLRRRLRFEYVHGHDRDETKELLELLIDRDDARLRKAGVLEEHPLVFELLTTGIFRGPDRRVATLDAAELVARMSALFRGKNAPSGADLVRAAEAHLVQTRTKKDGSEPKGGGLRKEKKAA